MTSIDHNGSPNTVKSPFFVAAIGALTALVVIAAIVVVIH